MEDKSLPKFQILVAFLVGFIFSLGLGISGMTQPHKVLAFLNLKGHWDPTLIMVMGGAAIVHFFAYRSIKGKESPLFDLKFHVPTSREITPQLVTGSIIFGIGWGIGGLCPGPALVSLASGLETPVIFVISMFIGMLLNRVVQSFINKK